MKKILWFSLSPCGSMRRNNSTKFTQTWMVTLEDELKKREEIQLYVAYFSNINEAPFEFEGVHYYPMSLASHNLKEKVRNIWGSKKAMDEYRLSLCLEVYKAVCPDLIHIHGTESMFGMIKHFVGNTPVLYSMQGVMSSIAEKYYSGFDQKEAHNTDSWRERFFNKSDERKFRNFIDQVNKEQLFLKSADYVCGRTDLDKNISGLFNPNRQYFVVNEIMRQGFLNNMWERKESAVFKIVSVLSAGIYKGYPTLLKTAELLTKYADFPFEWVVIGCDTNSKWVNAAIKKTGVDVAKSNLKFLGSQGENAIVEQELGSHLYVHTGQTENSPNTVCEAMCLGMPIIATFAGGTTSILEHKKEGFLVQDGDAYALAGAIVDIYKNYDKAVTWGYNARIKAIDRHTPQNVVNELYDTYLQILNK